MPLPLPTPKFRVALGWGLFPYAPAWAVTSGATVAEAPDQLPQRTGTGMDLRVFAALPDWTPAGRVFLAGQWSGTAATSSHALYLTSAGALEWKYANSTPAIVTVTTAALPAAVAVNGQPVWLRVVHDNDVARGGRLRIYYATDLRGASWTLHHDVALGSPDDLNDPAGATLVAKRVGRSSDTGDFGQAAGGSKFMTAEWRTLAGVLKARFSGDERDYGYDGMGLWSVLGTFTWSEWAGVPTNAWVDMTADLQEWHSGTGRGNEREDFEPGTATVRLKNRHRRYDPTYLAGPYYGKLGPGSPAIIEATWNGTTYPLFTGIIEDGWPTSFDQVGRGADAWVDVPLVDSSGHAALIEMPGSPWELAVALLRPAVWLRDMGTTLVSPVTTPNWSPPNYGNGVGYFGVLGTGGALFSHNPSLMPGDNNPSIFKAGNAQITTREEVGATDQFVLAATFVIDSPKSGDIEVVVQQVFLGAIQWTLFVGGTANPSAFLEGNVVLQFGAGRTVICGPPAGGSWSDGQPHHVVCSYNGATGTVNLSVDTEPSTNLGGTTPAAVTRAPLYIGRTTVGTGWGFDEIVFEPRYVYTGDLYNAVNGQSTLSVGTLAARVAQLVAASAADQPFPYPVVVDAAGPGATDTFYGYTDAPAADLRAALVDLAADMRGAVYALRDGTLRVRPIDTVDHASRTAYYRDTPAEFVSGVAPAFGRMVVAGVKLSGERLDLIVNVSTWNVPTAAGSDAAMAACTNVEPPSRRQYGRRTGGRDTRLTSGLAGYRYSFSEMFANAYPVRRVEALELHPLNDDAVTTWVLQQMDLERAVNVRVRPPADASAPDDTTAAFDSSLTDWFLSGNVQGIGHDWTKDDGWIVTIAVSRTA